MVQELIFGLAAPAANIGLKSDLREAIIRNVHILGLCPKVVGPPLPSPYLAHIYLGFNN